MRFIKRFIVDQPSWKKVYVESNLPERLSPLTELSRNLWWSWSVEARELFQKIDGEKWEECAHNPVILLANISYHRFLDIEKDASFLRQMDVVYEKFKKYIAERETKNTPSIAYFSMEYGIHDSLKIYSGGLGVLAGDYLKEASDSAVDLVGIGLLYRRGYFKQVLSVTGEQIAVPETEQNTKIPVSPAENGDGSRLVVSVDFPGRKVYAHVWNVNVGVINLYLLDTDIDENEEQDRAITHQLYGGDNEHRLKQEILLGFGGVKTLNALGIETDVYHCNEGHAAFMGLERMIGFIKNEELTFAEAKEVVRASTLFTTHTPVPAGHDSFPEGMLRFYLDAIPGMLGISWDEFIMLGKAYSRENQFNMSYLASHLSQGINGVSMLHGDVSKEILKELYNGYCSRELNIGYVTNGVHYKTWAAKEWKALHSEYFGDDFHENQASQDHWNRIYDVSAEKIWEVKHTLKLKLINYIKQRFADTWVKRHENPKLVTETLNRLTPDALTIGFARRFATYKRADLLFHDLERLSKIVNNPQRPVQIIFAGKAHPADKAGQDLIKKIVEISKRPEFVGKIVFVQNYDMNLAKKLVQGVDVWMNTPTRLLEASGTSGQKAVMNGTLHFSVLDGWWVEGYQPGAGWALPRERSYDVQDYQNQLDAETIYNILEYEIIPDYYDRNGEGVAEKWVEHMRKTFALVAPKFTTARMINDYLDKYYQPQSERAGRVKADKYKLARELAAWKGKIAEKWDQIEVLKVDTIKEEALDRFKVGESFPARVSIDLKGLSPEDIGVEFVFSCNGESEKNILNNMEFQVEKTEGDTCTYLLNLVLMEPGLYNYVIRIYPKNKELPHRQDFRYIKWV